MVASRDTAGQLDVHRLPWPRVTLDRFVEQIEPLVDRPRIGEPDAVTAALQAREVFARSKRRAQSIDRVDRNQLVDTVTEDESTVEHGNCGFGQRPPVSVQITACLLPVHQLRLRHQSLTASYARRNSPAACTLSNATIGASASVWSARRILTQPTRSPCARGASNGSGRSICVTSLRSPRRCSSAVGTVTKMSFSGPIGSSVLSPFQTSGRASTARARTTRTVSYST